MSVDVPSYSSGEGKAFHNNKEFYIKTSMAFSLVFSKSSPSITSLFILSVPLSPVKLSYLSHYNQTIYYLFFTVTSAFILSVPL